MSQEIEDLQARLSFQEDLINGLNMQVANQAQDMQLLQKQMQILYKKLNTISEHIGDVDEGDEPPPHY